MLYAEHQRAGHKLTVENIEHFGLGVDSLVPLIQVPLWMSGMSQLVKSIKTNQVITIYERDAHANPGQKISPAPLLNEVHQDYGLQFKHRERDFVDFLQGQILLPHKHSQGGRHRCRGY